VGPESDLRELLGQLEAECRAITITPEPAGGCLVTIELTTRPHHLTTTLTAIGLDRVPDTPENPFADDG